MILHLHNFPIYHLPPSSPLFSISFLRFQVLTHPKPKVDLHELIIFWQKGIINVRYVCTHIVKDFPITPFDLDLAFVCGGFIFFIFHNVRIQLHELID